MLQLIIMNKKALLAEFIGTFALVLCGTGAIVFNDTSQFQIGYFGIALMFGITVSLMIFIFGKTSGAHINPAVTLSLWLAGKFEYRSILPYMTVQFLGSFVASYLLSYIFPDHLTLGSTLPHDNIWSAFGIEIMLSFFLMLVIIIFSDISYKFQPYACWAIGMVVLLEAAFAGPFTGASMNPARSFGPAIISGNVEYLLHYMIAAFIGMALCIFTWRIIKNGRISFLR